MLVDKKTLEKNKSNMRELAMLEKCLLQLQEDLEKVPIVSGKVTASGKEFPYIEEHVTVQMEEPKAATEIKRKIRDKEKRRAEIREEMARVEAFIDDMPEGIEKRIFEMVYVEGKRHWEVAAAVGYERSSITKKIDDFFKIHQIHQNSML